MSIICEYHSIEEGPKLLRSCSKPHLSSLFLRELAQTVAGFPSEFTNTEHTHPRAARGFSDSQWVSCSPFKAITMYQSILFARGKTGKVKNDAMPPKVGRVALDRKRVFYNAMNGNLYCIFSTEKCSVIRKRGRQVEVASKFHPEFFGLNVRRNGPQPRTFVRSFSQITRCLCLLNLVNEHPFGKWKQRCSFHRNLASESRQESNDFSWKAFYHYFASAFLASRQIHQMWP